MFLAHGNGNSFLIIDARDDTTFFRYFPVTSTPSPSSLPLRHCRKHSLYCQHLHNPLSQHQVLDILHRTFDSAPSSTHAHNGFYYPMNPITTMSSTNYYTDESIDLRDHNYPHSPLHHIITPDTTVKRLVDGLVLVLPEHHPIYCQSSLQTPLTPSFTMFIYNNDGKQTEMCGNALRCTVSTIARIDALSEFKNNHTDPQNTDIYTIQIPHDVGFRVSTLAGDKFCTVHRTISFTDNIQIDILPNIIPGITYSTIDMQAPLFTPSKIPTILTPTHILRPHFPNTPSVPVYYPVIINIPLNCELLEKVYQDYINTAILAHFTTKENTTLPFISNISNLHSKLYQYLTSYPYHATISNTGVPHAIFFIDDSEDILPSDLQVSLSSLKLITVWDMLSFFFPIIGYSFTTHSVFPSQINVEFVRSGKPSYRQHDQDKIRFESLVNERGCGITTSCGTGCCAVAISAILTGRVRNINNKTPINVRMPGGIYLSHGLF